MCVFVQGRNADEQVKMIGQVRRYNSTQEEKNRITVSVEIEKTRSSLYQLFPLGDVVPQSAFTTPCRMVNTININMPVCVAGVCE